ncbi:MAG: hypothetical protein R3B96_16475 [Pirellulaceae bacterium]
MLVISDGQSYGPDYSMQGTQLMHRHLQPEYKKHIESSLSG